MLDVYTSGLSDEKEFRNSVTTLLLNTAAGALDDETKDFTPLPYTDLMLLTLKVKETRDKQKAYFASRNGGRFGDKAILKESKELEAQLDMKVQDILTDYQYEA